MKIPLRMAFTAHKSFCSNMLLFSLSSQVQEVRYIPSKKIRLASNGSAALIAEFLSSCRHTIRTDDDDNNNNNYSIILWDRQVRPRAVYFLASLYNYMYRHRVQNPLGYIRKLRTAIYPLGKSLKIQKQRYYPSTSPYPFSITVYTSSPPLRDFRKLEPAHLSSRFS